MPNPKPSIEQSSFLGGEWGPLAYGLSSDPKYTTALTTSLNGYPCEEGSWLKRSGTQFLFPTHLGQFANLLPFNGSATCAFAMEFTSPAGSANGSLRFITQSSLVMTNDAQTVTAISAGQIELSGNPSWSVGDEVMFVFPNTVSAANQLNVRNQVCTIATFTAGTNALMTVNAYFGGAVSVSSPNLVGATVLHVKAFTTPYTGGPSQLQSLRAVQAEVDSIILCPNVAPQQVQVTTQGTLSADPVFTFGALNMVDGPYLDPAAVSLTMSAISGSGVTLTAGGAIFASTDVGRHVRIFTQPAIYNPASTYSAGQTTTDSSGAWWVAIASVPVGVAPGTSATVNGVATVVWAPSPQAASWAWGKITAFTDSAHVTFTFDTTIPNMVLQSANGMSAFEWQLGVYSGTTGYPTCGIYYEGRLWLAGCVPNRFDTTISNGVSQIIGTNNATFSPTDPYGNVIDSSGISLTLNSIGINQIQWMIGDAQGVLMGTLIGETLVGASVLGDPITPTSIQAHEITRLGSENIEATRAGMAVVFAQRYQRRIIEYLDDAFSSKFSGRHLNKYSKHITASGVARLVYQEEPIPTIWALMNNGVLAGCTYRRMSRFVQTDPEAEGWHRHLHGANRNFTSMCSVPGKNGLLDRLFVVTNPPAPNFPGAPVQSNYYVEILTPPFDPTTNNQLTAWMLDQSGGPGPGNSGYDCGGGNPSAVFPSGFFQGADSTTASAPSLLQTFQGITLGASPPAGGELMLKGNATFFPGTVILYNMAKWGTSWPSNTSPTDSAMVSMSFWMGKGDVPFLQGALLSSPALNFTESQSATHSASGFFGPPSPFTSNQNAGLVAVYDGPNASEGNIGAYADGVIAGSGNTQWVHVMLSAKTNGDGTITVLCVCNDTTIFNGSASAGVLASTLKMMPFSSQQDALKDNGQAVWGVGGAYVENPTFDIKIQQTAGPVQTYTYPPLVSLTGGSPAIAVGGLFSAGVNAYTGAYGVPVAASLQGIYNNLYSPRTVSVQTEIITVTGSGGATNFPVATSLGQATGYIGNVAELWVLPGVYVDWTSSTNRAKFHEFDSITESWGPVPLGLTGTKPGLGTPWLYLSGPPKTFPLNNVTGVYMAELDTSSGLINFQTGLGGGLQASQLSFP